MKSTIVAGAMALACATPAFACSICRCGDPTFNALGKEGIAQTGLRIALDWDEVTKTQGSAGEGEQDRLREQRTTALFAYGISDRFSVYARVPRSQRRLTEAEEGETQTTRASGLADPEIYGQARLWSSPFEGDVGIRTSLYAIAGIKTDWGQNNLRRNGERLDEHAQPGTGSTDTFGGLAGSYQLNPHSALFASAQYRLTGRNDAGYRYGRTALFNLAYEYKLSARWDSVLEANFRHAGKDRFVSESGLTDLDPDTGGSVFYLTPRLLFNAGKGLVVRAAAQIPLGQSGLYGHQREKAVVNLGLTWSPQQPQ
jgi:hypothetical protein